MPNRKAQSCPPGWRLSVQVEKHPMLCNAAVLADQVLIAGLECGASATRSSRSSRERCRKFCFTAGLRPVFADHGSNGSCGLVFWRRCLERTSRTAGCTDPFKYRVAWLVTPARWRTADCAIADDSKTRDIQLARFSWLVPCEPGRFAVVGAGCAPPGKRSRLRRGQQSIASSTGRLLSESNPSIRTAK